jgi:hypothetical protein
VLPAYAMRTDPTVLALHPGRHRDCSASEPHRAGRQ